MTALFTPAEQTAFAAMTAAELVKAAMSSRSIAYHAASRSARKFWLKRAAAYEAAAKGATR